MKKTFYVFLLIFLPILSASIVYFNRPNPEFHYWFDLSGQSEHWKVEKAGFLSKPSGSYQDDGEITYLGKEEELSGNIITLFFDKKPVKTFEEYWEMDEVKEFRSSVESMNEDGDIVATGGLFSENPYGITIYPHDSQTDSYRLGGGSVPTPTEVLNHQTKNIDNILTRYIMFHWTTKDGISHTELVTLQPQNKTLKDWNSVH